MHCRCWQTAKDIKAHAQEVAFSLMDITWFLTELGMFCLFLHTYKPCMPCQANKASLNWNCFLIMVCGNTCGNSLPSAELQRWNWLGVSEGPGKQCSRRDRIQHPRSLFSHLHRANKNKNPVKRSVWYEWLCNPAECKDALAQRQLSAQKHILELSR